MNKFCYVMMVIHIFLYVPYAYSMLMVHEPYDKQSLLDVNVSCWFSHEKKYKKETAHVNRPAEKFMYEFDTYSLHSLSPQLCNLSLIEGTRVLGSLNDSQKFLVQLSCLCDDVKISMISSLFKGNRDFAQEYCTMPIGLLLERYTQTEQAMIIYDNFLKQRPYVKLDREVFKMYCLQLTSSERSVFVNGMKQGTIDKADVLEGVKAVYKLLQVNRSDHHKDLYMIAHCIRINPSLYTRLMVMPSFLKEVLHYMVRELGKETLSMAIIAGFYSSFSNRSIAITAFRMRTLFCCYGILTMCSKFSYFKQKMAEAYWSELSLKELVICNSPETLQCKYKVW